MHTIPRKHFCKKFCNIFTIIFRGTKNQTGIRGNNFLNQKAEMIRIICWQRLITRLKIKQKSKKCTCFAGMYRLSCLSTNNMTGLLYSACTVFTTQKRRRSKMIYWSTVNMQNISTYWRDTVTTVNKKMATISKMYIWRESKIHIGYIISISNRSNVKRRR